MFVFEVSVNLHHSGFGMYDASTSDTIVDPFDVFKEFEEVYELSGDKFGLPEPPEHIEDISGRVYNEPQHLFAGIQDKKVCYFGFEEATDSEVAEADY